MQNHQLAEGAKGMCKAAHPSSHLSHGCSRMSPHLWVFGFGVGFFLVDWGFLFFCWGGGGGGAVVFTGGA